MELFLQVNTGDGWYNLTRRYGDDARAELYQFQLRWQINYDPFRQAQFRIVRKAPRGTS